MTSIFLNIFQTPYCMRSVPLEGNRFGTPLDAYPYTQHHLLPEHRAWSRLMTGICCCCRDVSGPNRAKPMTATATAQVHDIWQQYFAAAPRPEEAADAAAAVAGAGRAKEVHEVFGSLLTQRSPSGCIRPLHRRPICAQYCQRD